MPLPVAILPCPRSGGVWLIAWDRLTVEDCERLARMLDELVAERRRSQPIIPR